MEFLTEREESIWLAALLEGEGSFVVTKPSYGRPGLAARLEMGDRDVIERAARLTGYMGSIYTRKRAPQNGSTHIISWYGAAAEVVMRRILPWMGERRRARIEGLLALDLSHRPRSLAPRCGRGHPYDEANTAYDPDGRRRRCRECARIRERKRTPRQRSTQSDVHDPRVPLV